jgi:hypothetical protein
VVNNLIKEKGVDELPLTVLDGVIIITGRYPTNDEFIELLQIPQNFLGEQKTNQELTEESEDCCCSGGSCC